MLDPPLISSCCFHVLSIDGPDLRHSAVGHLTEQKQCFHGVIVSIVCTLHVPDMIIIPVRLRRIVNDALLLQRSAAQTSMSWKGGRLVDLVPVG